ncbi:MAG: S-layer homology domain-containing protein, partial [Oscillospiraceae bacterium]|nr:S-layer homology domain-containing protein [Oscillospiraceae bacterium]
VELRLVTNPDSITVLRDGKAVNAITIGSEESVQLDAKAFSNHLALLSQNHCFSWTLSDEALGTIDENGLFTAGNRSVSGVITVSVGNTSVEIPVEVKNGDYFTDISDSFARAYINSLYERGVVTGKDDGSFAPNDPVTRQQFAAMLYRALELNDADYEDIELPFADKDGLRSYSLTPVKALYSMGIINGSSSGGKLYVSPYETLSRAQACAFVARAMGIASEEIPDYTDIDNFPSYAPSCVGALSELGIIGGYDDGSFRPRNNMTRAQVCKVLYLMLENQ